MDVLREQTPEPTGFDSDEADSGRGGDAIDAPIVVIVVVAFRGGSPPEGLAPYLDRVRGAPMIRLTRTMRGEGIRLFGRAHREGGRTRRRRRAR